MKRLLFLILANLFVSLHYASILYINSSFLGKYFSPYIVTFLYVLGAIGSILVFLISRRLLERLGNKRFFLYFLLIELVAVYALATATNSLIIAVAFLLYSSSIYFILYSLDIFLETITSERKTGEIRGIYLTTTNLAFVFAPFLFVLLNIGNDYQKIYTVSAFMLLPVFLIALFLLRTFKDIKPKHKLTYLPWKAWNRILNVRRVTIVRFCLETFYAVMIIYTPIYLHAHIGFSWPQIGLIFSIMLLPFVLLTWPVGEIADRWLGEKELMTAGLFIIGTSLLIMPFIGETVLWWAIILFVSRVGAATVEIATESYFFKHVDERDVGIISIFRMARPTAIIFGSILGLLLSSVLDFSSIYIGLAILILLATRESIYLKDTL